MTSPLAAHAISHWQVTLDGVQLSPTAFYDAVREAITSRGIPDVRLQTVEWREGGMFSTKRLYLRIQRGKYFYDICGAPFGNSFFVSSRLSELPPILILLLLELPVLSWFGYLYLKFLDPETYYKVDTAMMFQGAVHAALLSAVDRFSAIGSGPPLTELERRPVMRELYAKK